MAPVFVNCPGPISAWADKGKSTTVVTWDVPMASDEVDGDITAVQTDGPQPGSELTVGLHQIIYTAEDTTGSQAVPCSFVVGVKGQFGYIVN